MSDYDVIHREQICGPEGGPEYTVNIMVDPYPERDEPDVGTYGFEIEDPNGDECGSCWGFVASGDAPYGGALEGGLARAKAMAKQATETMMSIRRDPEGRCRVRISLIVEVADDVDDSTLLDETETFGERLAAEYGGELVEGSPCVEW